MEAAPPPLHARIRADLAGRIASGELPAGARIPVEHELMALWGCSRMTVSRALAALAQDGLIERRKRAGTIVAAPRPRAAVLAIPDMKRLAEAMGETHRYVLLSRRVRAPARCAEETRLAPSPRLLELTGAHHAGARPLAHETRLIDLATVPAAAERDFADTAPGDWLLHHVAWSEAEHRIAALPAAPAVAEALRLEEGHACLALDRWTWRGGAGVTYARQIFPYAMMTLTARFTPAG